MTQTKSMLSCLNPFGNSNATSDRRSSRLSMRHIQSSESAPDIKSEQRWSNTIEHITPAIVSLRVNRVRQFEGQAGGMQGTGFVVDKKRGIILTNRHVVTLGPVTAEASFHSLEEVQVKPIYRDPVHDFGFFQFDPKDVEFTDLEEIPLVPDLAKVGTDIKVIGNDNGEQLTILSGTLSRIDRDAPGYDINTFYFTSASSTSGGSSGSPVVTIDGNAVALNSGGLASGGATSFFLPLDRALRALRLIQGTKPGEAPQIPRGSLQCVFRLFPFDEVRRLGVPKEEETLVRKEDPVTKGMLVVCDMVPNGPAHKAGLQGGDVVLTIDGKRIHAFTPLAEIFDEKAKRKFHDSGSKMSRKRTTTKGVVKSFSSSSKSRMKAAKSASSDAGKPEDDSQKKEKRKSRKSDAGNDGDNKPPKEENNKDDPGAVTVVVQRGTERLTFHASMCDLHSITPNEYIEVSRAIIQPLGYLHALQAFLPLPMVLLALPGYMFSRADVRVLSAIVSINDVLTPDLDAVMAVLTKLEDGERAMIRYFHFEDSHQLYVSPMIIDKRWFPVRRARRNVLNGLFDYDDEEGAPSTSSKSRKSSSKKANKPKMAQQKQQHVSFYNDETILAPSKPDTDKDAFNWNDIVRRANRAMVTVEFHCPYQMDGNDNSSYMGVGAIVDHKHGLVLVDQNTVVGTLGDATVTLADSVEVPAEVVFVHPVYNYALVKFDPNRLDNDNLESLPVSDVPLALHDKVMFTGTTRTRAFKTFEAKVTAIDSLTIGEVRSAPRFIAKNHEVYSLDKEPERMLGGVMVDENGEIRAMEGSFAIGGGEEFFSRYHPVGLKAVIQCIVDKKEQPEIPFLGIKYETVMLSSAAKMGLPKDWFHTLDEAPDSRKQRKCMRVGRLMAGTDAAEKLQVGDIILSFNDVPTVTPTSADQMLVGKLDNIRPSKKVATMRVKLVRRGEVLEVDLAPKRLGSRGTDRLVVYCGMITQPAHNAVAFQGFMPDSIKDGGVYISACYFGSPGSSGSNGTWIIEVNGHPTPGMDDFVQEIKKIGHRETVRVRTIDLTGKMNVFTLRTDLHYWTTSELVYDKNASAWKRINL